MESIDLQCKARPAKKNTKTQPNLGGFYLVWGALSNLTDLSAQATFWCARLSPMIHSTRPGQPRRKPKDTNTKPNKIIYFSFMTQ